MGGEPFHRRGPGAACSCRQARRAAAARCAAGLGLADRLGPAGHCGCGRSGGVPSRRGWRDGLARRVQARQAQAPPRRRGAALRPGAVPGGDDRPCRARRRALLRRNQTAGRRSVHAELRRLTEETAAALATLFDSRRTPPPTTQKSRCRACSLREQCRPESAGRDVRGWRRRMVGSALAGGEGA